MASERYRKRLSTGFRHRSADTAHQVLPGQRTDLSVAPPAGYGKTMHKEEGEDLGKSRGVTGDVSAMRPNFLIIGAAKSGTTALWHSLRQHPQVYMSPRKHTRFFAFKVEDPDFQGSPLESESVPYAITDVAAYHALFDGVTNETAIGEASHSYLYQPDAPERIYRYAPGMKLIAILRNPAERAYSHHRQMIRDGREPLNDFIRALEAEETRIYSNWWPDFHYVQIGLYSEQLKRYLHLFERGQVKIHLYEDLISDPEGVMQSIFQFLGVDDTSMPETKVIYNASGSPKNKALHLLLQKMRLLRTAIERIFPEGTHRSLLRLGSSLHNRNLTKARLSPEVRRQVTEDYFREDILKLQLLIRRDLSAWLK